MHWNMGWRKRCAVSAGPAARRSETRGLPRWMQGRPKVASDGPGSGGECGLVGDEIILERLRLLAGQPGEVVSDDIELAGADIGIGRDQHVGNEARQSGAADALTELLVVYGNDVQRLAGGFGGDCGDFSRCQRLL